MITVELIHFVLVAIRENPDISYHNLNMFIEENFVYDEDNVFDRAQDDLSEIIDKLSEHLFITEIEKDIDTIDEHTYYTITEKGLSFLNSGYPILEFAKLNQQPE